MIVVAGVFVTGFGSQPASAQTPPTYSWPYPAQNSSLTGLSSDPTLSTANAGSFGVHWMTNAGSEVLSSPIVAYNSTLGETLVYVTTNAGLVTAFNQATGLPVWSVNLGGSIVSSPLAEGDYLWVAMQHGGRIYKLDSADGSVACSRPSNRIVDQLVTHTGHPSRWEADHLHRHQRRRYHQRAGRRHR